MNQGLKQTLLAMMAMVMAAGAVAQVKVHDPGDVIIGDLTNASQSASASNLFRFPDAFDLRGLAIDATTPADQFKWSYFSGDGKITINGVPSMAAGVDDPINPPANRRIDQIDADRNDQDGFDGNPFTVTFRNNDLSPVGGPYVNPPTTGILPGETRMVSLMASNGTTYSLRTIAVYTSNNTSDRLSNDATVDPTDPTATPPPVLDDEGNPIDDVDMAQPANSGRWTAFSTGQASFSTSASGLCLTTPLTGDNTATWLSPRGFVPLVDNAVYRVRMTVTGSQTDLNAIPLWNLGYDNFNGVGAGGNNFGGEAWFLDVDGGANGVSDGVVRIGRSNFEAWIAPNAVSTKQWQGIVDFDNSAFAPAAETINDISLFFRVNDIGSAAVEANSDEGDLCLKSITVNRFQLNQLTVAASGLQPDPISTTTYFAESFTQVGVGGTASIDDGTNTANYVLDELTSGSARKSLGPWNQVGMSTDPADMYSFARLYPVAWKADTLYRGRIKIRSNASVEGTNPVEVIALAFDTTNSELGQSHYSTLGSPGNMHLAASPRLAATTGGAQWYTGFFYGQAGTVSVVPETARTRLFGDFFSTSAFTGTGNDPFTVEALEVTEITKPN